jgi:peptide-methionine (R)-S-oxide reductase
MPTRRQFIAAAVTTLGLAPVVVWIARPARMNAELDPATFPVRRSDAEWEAALSPAAYRVLRNRSTERPFSSSLDHETRRGTYVCAGCAHPLFASDTKFDSGTGWPSFWQPLDGAVGTSVDRSWFMVRTEVHCAECGGHLGHVFSDGPPPTGLRYCMNGVAMRFVPEA